MFKKNYLIILTLCLTSLIGSWAFAETCPDVVGDWDFTVDKAICYGISDCGYESLSGTYHITNQNGCLFYGYREFSGSGYLDPITGVIPQMGYPMRNQIVSKPITWSASSVTHEGYLGDYDPVRCKYNKIEYTILYPGGAGYGIATRE